MGKRRSEVSVKTTQPNYHDDAFKVMSYESLGVLEVEVDELQLLNDIDSPIIE